jgi:hypothetical protein
MPSKDSYIHKDRPWLKNVLKASGKRHHLYLHGIESLKDDIIKFEESGTYAIDPFNRAYRPNPFFYQYDLEIHIFLNYKKLLARETMRLRRRLSKTFSKKDEDRLKVVTKLGPSGIPRHEHLFNAAEIRWPTIELGDGRLDGSFIRDPWSIKRMEAVSDKNTFTIAFGGGGQGKTWTFLGFMLMIFEHFIFTRNGAKMSFSSINKDKINNVAWPHLQKLCMDTEKDVSLYAGKSVVSGDWTLKRPGKGIKDTGGVFKGILVGRHLNDSVVIDKLTGTHGHEAYGYLIDEIQNTPKAPIDASANYLMSRKPAWIIGAGNYDQDDDTLGLNAKPLSGGWEKVDASTGKWQSETIIGARATVIHFNNELSPGMISKEDAKRFPYLPNQEKKDSIYPKGKCTMQNMGARRFWFGWRSTDIDEHRVLTPQLVSDGQANKDLVLDPDYPSYNFGSLDTAESGGDRNPFSHFSDGMEKDTERWVWGLVKCYNIEAPNDPRRNQDVLTDEVLRRAKNSGIKPDLGIIMDGTKNTGYAGKFSEKGYNVVSFIYHKNLPDGKREDKYTRRKEPAILVNPNAPSTSGRYAHQICYNHITFGAFLLREYVAQGKVRGLNDKMLTEFNDNRTLEEEMYRRSFLPNKITSDFGDRLCLDSKEDFVHSYKFSPDILDTWFQAAYYMFFYRGMPLYDEVEEDNPNKKEKEEERKIESDELIEAHAGIWEDDDYNFMNENY